MAKNTETQTAPLNDEKSLNLMMDQGSEKWFYERIGRITSSMAGSILLFAKTEEEKHRLGNIICGLEENIFTKEEIEKMEIGSVYESNVRKVYEKKINQKIFEVGTSILRENPNFSGSVDGVLENGFLLEIKITEKDFPLFYFSNHKEIPLWYIYQMQMNMFITGSEKCHYVCYHRNDQKLYTKIINFDQDIIDDIYPRLINFHSEYVMPKLIKHNIKTPLEKYNDIK